MQEISNSCKNFFFDSPFDFSIDCAGFVMPYAFTHSIRCEFREQSKNIAMKSRKKMENYAFQA